MRSGIISQKNGSRRGSSVIKTGPPEQERLKAMMDYKKNVKPGDYIDQDLYGRGDVRVFTALSSSFDGNMRSQNEDKSASTRKSPKAKFVSVSFMGKKVRSFMGKLAGTMNCFGRSSARASEVNDADLGSPITSDSQPASPAPCEKSSDLQQREPAVSSANGDEPEKQTSGHKAGTIRELEEVGGSPGKRDLCINEEDSIPHRVKSKVGSDESTTVVQKGMVERTLVKLRSTGSFVFKEPRSLTSQEREKPCDDLQPDQTPRQDSRSLVGASHEHGVPTIEEEKHVDVSVYSHKKSDADADLKTSSELNGDNEVTKKESGIHVDSELAPATYVPSGDVKRLRSIFEDDCTDVHHNFLLREKSTRVGEISKDVGLDVDGASHLRSKGSAGFLEDTTVRSSTSASGGSTKEAPAVHVPFGDVKGLRSLFEDESPNVPDTVVVRTVSSATKASLLISGLRPLNEAGENRAHTTTPEAMCDEGDCVETQPLASLQELSSHRSGHVEKMKSLFESPAPESPAPDTEILDEEVNAVLQNVPIRAGLSCDSGVFEEDGGSDELSSTEAEVRSTTDDGIHEETESKRSERNDGVENRMHESAVMRGGDHGIDSKDNTRDDDEIETEHISVVVVDENATVERGASTELSERSSEGSLVDTMQSSTSSGASTDDLAHPVSHLVGSCSLM